MKKVIAILILVFTGVSAMACGANSEYSDLHFNDSISETLFSESGDEALESNEETDSSEMEPDSSDSSDSSNSSDSSTSGGTVVKPITGGGDFNAGKNY